MVECYNCQEELIEPFLKTRDGKPVCTGCVEPLDIYTPEELEQMWKHEAVVTGGQP
jgi:hypothetical protein